MNILVLPSWYPPNGGRFFKYQAEELAKLGHSVEVLILEEKGLTSVNNKKINSQPSEFIKEYRNTYYRIPKLNTINIELFIKKYKKLLQNYIKNKQIDIIHVHSAIWAGVVVADIATKYNIPYVITEHRSIFFKEKFPFSERIKKRVVKAFNNAQKIIVVSELMKFKLQKFSKIEIEVIPNMVDTFFFKPSKSCSKKKETFTFISVGNLIHVKGFDILIKAFSYFKEENVILKIIGKGFDEKKLKNLVNEKLNRNSLNKKVYFCGYKTKKELLEEYNTSHVLVSASRKEPFGLTIIEAMSCGLPVVATKSGGPNDIINQNNGYLAATENVEELYLKMKKMYEQFKCFDSEKIREEVINKYSKEVVVKKIEKVLKTHSKCQIKKQ